MECDATRERLRDPALKNPGKELVALQRSVWPALGFDPEFGCACLDRIDAVFTDDIPLCQGRERFVRTAQRMFLRALRDRPRGALEKTAPMPRQLIVEFLDACNIEVDLPETHERLLDHVKRRKAVPKDVVVGMQKDLLEVLGVQRDHGCRCLARVPFDFPDDEELFGRMAAWRQKAQSACMLAMQVYQASGGKLLEVATQQPFGPGSEELVAQARRELDAMTPSERGQFLTEWQQKFQQFAALPAEGSASFLKGLSERERIDLVKAQFLLSSVTASLSEKAAKEGQSVAAAPARQPQSAPPQQQMM
eukprot:NODE_12335_length_1231_cov_2.618659.p2 GENE.NODE_12335_length_1231_cov_2.618659~~NODE_12335_length_1231_cov_2.618659.p2  ORF type:complete len:360 (+),score=124.52 NODE_12335_length_1231_cov_2.618659:162-1082(+)